MKIVEVESINFEGSIRPGVRSMEEYIEIPCLAGCKKLYDLNIETTMSSANKKDVGKFAYIGINFESLSGTNKEIFIRLSQAESTRAYFTMTEDCRECEVKIRYPISQATTVEEVSSFFEKMCEFLGYQDVLYGTFASKKEVCDYLSKVLGGVDMSSVSDDELKDLGIFFSEDNGLYYTSQLLYEKHKKYVAFIKSFEQNGTQQIDFSNFEEASNGINLRKR